MDKFNYTFIIPHHNSPEMLLRCVDSIPRRNDIEIIVVDDNSDEDKHPFNLRDDCKLINIDSEHSNGAGHARNCGLDLAKGKWILFADCDDFYEKDFITYLDVFLEKPLDIVFFDCYYAYDLNTKQERRTNKYSLAIEKYFKSNKSSKYLLTLKHIIQTPWNFMIKRDYILFNSLRFEEVRKGNDARFHHVACMLTNRVDVINVKLYYWLWNSNSITHQHMSKKQYLESLKILPKMFQYHIDANSWNTIPSFFCAFKPVLTLYGIPFTIKYLVCKLFCGVNWGAIWFRKLVFLFK